MMRDKHILNDGFWAGWLSGIGIVNVMLGLLWSEFRLFALLGFIIGAVGLYLRWLGSSLIQKDWKVRKDQEIEDFRQHVREMQEQESKEAKR